MPFKSKPQATHLRNRVVVRFTDVELQQISRKIKTVGVSDRSEYIRKLVREDLQKASP